MPGPWRRLAIGIERSPARWRHVGDDRDRFAAGVDRVECGPHVGSRIQSHEGRDIPLVILTNRATGPDAEKPAFWLDANIHATELTASMAALYFINKMVNAYGSDPKVTRILDEQVVYVVPRLNPDGAELALAETPKYVRSGTRPYPFEEKRDGLHTEDIDGDGRILQMRIADPTGDWKVSDRDPRLMIKRGPDEDGGTYYRMFPEGLVEDYDGHIITMAPPVAGLDFNRNFPGRVHPDIELSFIMSPPLVVAFGLAGDAARNLSLIHISEPTRPY
mgnify:CR=1 FL=1